MSDSEERGNEQGSAPYEERGYKSRGYEDRRPERSGNRYGDRYGRDGGGGGDRDRRDRGGGGGGDRSYALSEEMDVPSDCIGKIIGRAGSNIQRVQTDFNVRMDLDKGRNVLKISGNSEGNIKDAMQHIQGQIDSGNSDRGGGGGGYRDGGGRGSGGYGGGRRGDSRRGDNDWGDSSNSRRDNYSDNRGSGSADRL